MSNDFTTDSPPNKVDDLGVNPPAMPERQPVQELGAIEVPEIDISGIQFEGFETFSSTLGSIRPIQGYQSIFDLAWMNEYNQGNGDTLADEKLPHDSKQVSINFFAKGTNFIMPLSLPPTAASASADTTDATVLDSDSLEALFFQGNGPSIATPGSTRRAAVEQAAATMRSQIINSFNRDLPFTEIGLGARTLLMSLYESETLGIQMFFQAFDRMRGLAKFFADEQIPLAEGWQNIYDPNLYSAMLAVYNGVQDLLVYDEVAHKRLETLGRFFSSRKRGANPGSIIVQDIIVGRPYGIEGKYVKAQNSAYHNSVAVTKYKLSHVIPVRSMLDWIQIFLSPNALTEIQAFNALVKQVRTQYEVVITALNQMMARDAIKLTHLSEYLPVKPTAYGSVEFADSCPTFSYAFQERFEYAPMLYRSEDGGLVGSLQPRIWSRQTMPAVGATTTPSNCQDIRPIGLRHGKEVWKVPEVVDIGVFKYADTAAYAGLCGRTNGSGTYAVIVDSDIEYVTCFVDAVYGDMYCSGIFSANSNRVIANRWVIGGMSVYAPGTLNNMLDPPMAGSTTSVSNVGLDTAYVGKGWMYVDDLASTQDCEDVTASNWFMNQLSEQFGLSFLVKPRRDTNGSRCIPAIIQRGYADSGYYEYSMPIVDNAAAKAYLDFVPLMQYKAKK